MSKLKELELIEEFYSNRVAKRSNLPLINHIYEGVMILEALNASTLSIKAFCLHPIVQNKESVDVRWSEACGLAEEYAEKANSYLCRPETDWITTVSDIQQVVGVMSEDCKLMLLADKYQNRKDFNIHHKQTHTRSKELSRYFDLWIKYLEQL